LAKAAKRAGDSRILDHIRADLFLGMTDGTYTGLTDTEIIEFLTTAAVPDANHPHEGAEEGNIDPGLGGPDRNGADSWGPDDSGPGDGAEAGDGEFPLVSEPV
jgi:hypothetical protein